MKILFQIPSLESVYAHRFIYEGYKDAFTDLGHDFRPLTSSDNLEETLNEFQPDIFFTQLNSYCFRFLDPQVLQRHRKQGLVMFTQLQPWRKQNQQFGGGALDSQTEFVEMLKNGLAGDVFFHWMEQDEPTMQGFTEATGRTFETIMLAANRKLFFPEFDARYQADISYVGSFLKDKRAFFREHLLPLTKKYRVRLYGSDWTATSRALGYVQKVGQWFNIDALKHVRKISLPMDDERKVYTSSTISLNIHEHHQRRDGSDFNERTLKVIASGGFEICDNVRVLRRYFTPGELVIGENTRDWFDKIEHYMKNPDERLPIIKGGPKQGANSTHLPPTRRADFGYPRTP
jgi:spore maturation protein CgeB